MNDKEKRPIFIVGCPRSGTTLLRLILDSHSNISCGPETKFLQEFDKIFNDYWDLIERFGFNQEFWHYKIADFFNSFQMEYAQKRGKIRWSDKSPSYTVHLNLINSLFPNCQIVHIIRDGRDVVASHRDRWGYKVAMKAVRKWRNYVTFARNFGKQLPADRYFELRYEDLVKQPEPQLKALFDYLQEPWEPRVLNYNDVSHDVGNRYASFTESRRQSGKNESTIYSSQVGAAKSKLDPFLLAHFHLRAGVLLKELGYQ